jgi:diacylglycerol kinase family enzyme
LVILKPFPAIFALILGVRLFTNSFSKSKFVTVIKESEFSIKVPSPYIIHFDGEPKTLNTNELNVKIEKEKLSIIV